MSGIARACSVEACEDAPRRRGWCMAHYSRWRRWGDSLGRPKHVSVEVRFLAKVDKDGPGGCWVWTGSLHRKGYGRFSIGRRNIQAHRFAYEHFVGPVPEGLQLDHLCRNRPCVNPAHLEPVTGRENARRSPFTLATINARKTHCINGHEYTPENTRVTPQGRRVCRACHVANARRSRSRKVAS